MTNKKPTWTSLVLEHLHNTDDFQTYAMLMRATGGNVCQISAACHHLRKRGAVDVIIEPNGVGWWYATPITDDRTRTVDQRTPEMHRLRLRHHYGPRRAPIRSGQETDDGKQ